ncbi:hypothetical protein BV898_01714 [Hypsibius exemplaris]|uniref:Uncharacterized protein n=1 Tax=Hypsibius exemplaris TaxID=2072580 RepID=A0A1W0XAW5_HYPEX|nr:hypothetical protein BV898_01714 [Hypsibius exemplaris]
MEDDYEDSPWNSVGIDSSHQNHAFRGTHTDSSNSPIPNESFVEHGGNSIGMMSSFLSLKQLGSEVTIEDFLKSSLAPGAFSSAINNLSEEKPVFHKKPLSEVPKEEVVKLLAEAFAYRGNLGGEDIVPEDVAVRVRLAWPTYLAHSFAMVDSAGELVGVATLTDFAGGSEPDVPKGTVLTPRMVAIGKYYGSLIEKVEVPKRIPHPLEKGMVLEKDMIAPLIKMSPAESFYIVYLMEEAIHKIARENNYKMSLAWNTSALTQQFAEFFGCERVLTDAPNRHVSLNGERPFKDIPETTLVTMDIKYY